MLTNQICVLYARKSCPIVGELTSSPMEGKYDPQSDINGGGLVLPSYDWRVHVTIILSTNKALDAT